MSKEIEALEADVRKHNRLYWVEHKPVLSDPEYDRLVEKLRKADPKNPALDEFVEDSGSKGKIDHEAPMLSLEKYFEVDKVVAWATAGGAFTDPNPCGLLVSYKVDGTSCSLLYEEGKLVRAATRGNGKRGDDITANARMIAGVPHTIPSKKKVEVRGEVYMTRASFNEAVASFERAMKLGEATEDDRPSNARNYCAGSLKQKDPKITKERKLSFMAHNCIIHEGGTPQKTEFELLSKVSTCGFEHPMLRVIKKEADVAKAIADVEKARKSLPYDTDGVVFSINAMSIWPELGCTSHHPRYKIAYKFARDQGKTKIIRVNWETSRTGRLAPTIQVEQINLGGADVNLCTVHNAKLVRDWKLAPGDEVLLEREVIPYLVEKTNSGGEKTVLPSECPTCKTAVEWDGTETQLMCPNSQCPAQLQDYLAHYVSRKVVNIMGVGETLIEKLLQAKLLKTPADFFRLTEAQIRRGVESQGETSAKNVIDSIAEHKEQTLPTFLYSLGIPALGNTISEKLADKFGTLDKILASGIDDFKGDKIGEKLAKAIHEGLAMRKDLIKDLLSVVDVKDNKKVVGVLTGKSFCLTGHVEFEYGGKNYDARPDIEALIKSKGGACKSVSKELSYLVAGDGAGDKKERATKLKVPIIDGKALLKMLD